MPDLPAVVLQK